VAGAGGGGRGTRGGGPRAGVGGGGGGALQLLSKLPPDFITGSIMLLAVERMVSSPKKIPNKF